jgi:hypothetical protein
VTYLEAHLILVTCLGAQLMSTNKLFVFTFIMVTCLKAWFILVMCLGAHLVLVICQAVRLSLVMCVDYLQTDC